MANQTATCLDSKDRVSNSPSGRYAKSDVPKRHRRAISGEHCPKEWIETLTKIIEKQGKGYLIALIGNRGTGKTQISERAIRDCCDLGYPALYCRSMDFFLEVRATFKSETVTELSVIERFRSPRLLVLDEFQERGDTEWENRVLNNLLDKRYGDMSDTILIANLVPKAFEKSVGESIADRMRETGGLMECTWKSFRSSKANSAKA